MKRALMILPLLAALLFFAFAGSAEESYSASCLVKFTDNPPAELAEALAASPWAGAKIIAGRADRRFERWEYTQMILQDDASVYWLCCGNYDEQDGWQLTASSAALRQDEAPELVSEAERYGYTDEQVGSNGGCYQFDVVYPDVRYGWFFSSAGPALTCIETASEQIDVTRDTVTLLSEDSVGGVAGTVYNTLPITLDAFDISAFPTDWESLTALADASPESNRSLARLIDAPAADGAADGAPTIPLYDAPSEGAQLLARTHGGVNASALEERDGYVRLRIGGFEAWAKRENVLLGGERAGIYNSDGQVAQVYAYGRQNTQPLYEKPAEDAAVTGMLRIHERILVQLALDGGEWFYVKAGSQLGWMRFDTLCETDNFYDAWVYSEDPALRLNLRVSPDKSSDSLGRYYSGVHVVRLCKDKPLDGWTRVIIEGVSGYMQSSFLLSYSDYNGKEWLPPIATVSGVDDKGAKLRNAPNENATPLSSHPNGTKAEVLAVSGSWAHVRLRDGSSGYLPLNVLGGEPERAAENAFTLLQPALTFEGEIAIPAGETVRIAERPYVQWHYPLSRGEEDVTLVYAEPAELFAVTDSACGYIAPDGLSLDW